MKIYTKSGDSGETGLFGGARLSKASLRVGAYGDVDELNSVLGLCRRAVAEEIDTVLAQIQVELFNVGAELASNPDKPLSAALPTIDSASIERLEQAIDGWEAHLPALTNFIVPGGGEGAARLHLARTVARRAERQAVALAADGGVRAEVLQYLNRLSDAFFVMARRQNQLDGTPDVLWQGRAGDE